MGLLEMRNRWIEMAEAWVAAVKMVVMIAGMYPRSAYHGFSLSLQAEWKYLCHCVPGVGKHLAPVEEAIRDHFIHALLEVLLDAITDKLRTLLSHNVRGGGEPPQPGNWRRQTILGLQGGFRGLGCLVAR